MELLRWGGGPGVFVCVCVTVIYVKNMFFGYHSSSGEEP